MAISMKLWAFFLLIILFFTFIISVESGAVYLYPKRKRVRCTLIRYLHCYLFWQYCPMDCPTSCVIDCCTCKPICSCNYPGAVCQDPRFVGGDGTTFYFHGKKDHDFCLVSDENLHINTHFIGKRIPNMKRDFTWVQSLGILFDDHHLLVSAKRTSTWIDNVDHLTLAFDGHPISLPTNEGAMWQPQDMPHVTMTRTTDVNGVMVEVMGSFKVTAMVVPISAEESRVHGYNISVHEDCFGHLELGFKFYRLSDNVDGLLGRTYREGYLSRAKMGVAMPVLGGNDKYSSSSLFATDCAVSRFAGGLQEVKLKINVPM